MHFGNVEWSAFWSAVSAITSIGVLLFTARYVWLTHKLARIAEIQSWEAGRARVIAILRTNQGGQMLLLDIQNVGAGVAEDLKVSVSKPLFQQFGELREITEAPFFKDGMRAMPPKSSIPFGIGVAHQWLNQQTDRDKHPSSFEVTVEYTTSGRSISDKFPIDIVQQLYFSAVDRDYVDDFARRFPDKFEKGIRDLERHLKTLAQPASPPPFKRKSWSDSFQRNSEARKWDSW